MFENLVLEPLSIEEMVAQDSSVEDSFHFCRGVWWRRIKPFFYQPASFFQSFDPGVCSPDPGEALLGYHHLVEEEGRCNAYFHVLFNRNVKSYSVDVLAKKDRQGINRALKCLSIRKIEDLDELLTDGHETYVSFRNRTGWGRDKTDFKTFAGWITKAFALDKRYFLGCYFENKLVAFSQPYVVDGVATPAVFIGHTDYLQYRPNDLMLHAFLTICRNSPAVRAAIGASVSLKPTLDRFKMKYGFEAERMPTFVKVNQLVKPLLRLFYAKKYDQLMGKLEPEDRQGVGGEGEAIAAQR